jgi:hypothetical protein
MSWYLKRIHTDRLEGLTSICPDCKREMSATGDLFLDHPPVSRWVVEYHCDRCQEFFSLYSPEHEAVINAIVHEETKEDIT